MRNKIRYDQRHWYESDAQRGKYDRTQCSAFGGRLTSMNRRLKVIRQVLNKTGAVQIVPKRLPANKGTAAKSPSVH